MTRLYPPFEHEYELRREIKKILGNRGGIFIDVGAHVGSWAIDLAPYFDKVYAVEPWPEYAEQLRLNLKDYGIDNVEVLEVAAWDFDGYVLLGMNSIDVPEAGLPGKLVKSARLDSIISKPFRLLKVDVEGYAMHVLRGMTKLLSSSSGIAVIEVHNHGESHGTYLFMLDHGWKLMKTLDERHDGDRYYAYKVYVK
jgi:FkbM family methyltransferase